MKKLNFIILLIFSKKFYTRIKWVLSYAYRASEKVRGHGSSDIILFDDYWYKIFDEQEMSKLHKEQQEFVIPSLRELQKAVTNAMIKLQYGQKILFPTNPIQYSIAPGMGISSSDECEMAEFIVDKYNSDDTDANNYKVKLVPVDQSGRIPYEKVYSSDLKKMLLDGDAQFIPVN